MSILYQGRIHTSLGRGSVLNLCRAGPCRVRARRAFVPYRAVSFMDYKRDCFEREIVLKVKRIMDYKYKKITDYEYL
jgi:hypothetical protein